MCIVTYVFYDSLLASCSHSDDIQTWSTSQQADGTAHCFINLNALPPQRQPPSPERRARQLASRAYLQSFKSIFFVFFATDALWRRNANERTLVVTQCHYAVWHVLLLLSRASCCRYVAAVTTDKSTMDKCSTNALRTHHVFLPLSKK